MLTVPQAATALGVTPSRVHALIKCGRLPAEKIGRDWLIREEDLAALPERKTGRPVSTGAGLRRKDRKKVDPA